jgi:hypothetical protein
MLFSNFGIVTPKNLSQKSLQSTINIDPVSKVDACIVIDVFLFSSQAIPSLLLSYGKELHDPLL